MLDISPHDLLRIVDALASATATERGVELWRVLEPDAPPEVLWAAPVGALVHALLDVRVARAGPSIELHDRCPACDEEIEFEVDVPGLRSARPPRDNPPFEVEIEGRTLSLRRLSCADQHAVEQGRVASRQALVARCVVEGAVPTEEGALERIDAILGERDPQADISFALECPACAHRWEGVFDACGVVWSELSREATQLMMDVDALARVYHWSEAEILALPERRRRKYLELVSG